MIANRTRARWQQFSAAGVLFALASCSSESIAPQQPYEADEPGALQGELAVYIADYDDGTTETRYFLRDAAGVEQRLAIKGELDVTPGKKVKIWGQQRGEVLEVAKYKIVGEMAGEGIGSQAQKSEIMDATQQPGRELCTALVNLSGGTAKSTLDSVKNSFHVGTGSVDAYYRENSFGQVGLAGGDYGPFTYTMSGCDYSGLATSVKPMIKAQNAACTQFAFVMGPQVSSCGWSGLGQVGTSDKPASDTWYNDSVSCVVAVQEPGHNYGMQHSSSITCSGGIFADDPSSCTHSEYGDKYDTMGGGCYHMNGWQKLYQKWFASCNGVRTTSSGKFNLYPLENPCNGVQVLQLPFPGAKTRTFQSTSLTSYYLELRTATGFDSKYGSPSVLIHVGGAPILPNQANPKGLHTWALAAGGTTTWGLAAGKTFSDPAGGLTITIDSVDTTHAVVDVNYASGSGSPICLDGSSTPFVPPGSDSCGAPPTVGDSSTPPTTADARTDTGTGGTGGTGVDAAGGTAGIAGSSGSSGSAGKAGSGGTGGTGGSTGGTGGTTGGTGGDTGGTGGATGGTGGDTGGRAGDAGKSGGRPPANPEDLNGGCGCKVGAGNAAGANSAGFFMLGLVGWLGARRRRRHSA